MKLFSQDGLPFASPPRATRWALLIGINKYPFLGDVDLDGGVNDAQGYKAVLQERFDFPEENITLLLDEAATHDAILSAFDRLIAVVQEGDQVVLSYSGHGRRMASPDSLEADQMDETFVPADSGSGFYPNRDIRDDEFLWRIVQLTQRGAFVTFFCDCCHSSASLRDDFRSSTRGVAVDLRRRSSDVQQVVQLNQTLLPIGSVDVVSQASAPLSNGSASVPHPSARGVLRPERYVYVAACRDAELAAEHIEQTDAGPQVHGALSYHLQRELASCRPGEAMRSVIDRAFAALTAEKPEQHPRAEGALGDAPLFVAEPIVTQAQTTAASSEQRATVRERTGRTVVLSVGRLHGETLGSRYVVYPRSLPLQAGLGEPGSPLGVVEITALGATTCSAKILLEDPASSIAPGCLAIEHEHHAALDPLRIELCADPDHPELSELSDEIDRLETELAQVPEIDVVRDGSANLRVYALAPRGQPSVGGGVDVAVPSAPVPQLGALAASVWALVGRDGQLRAPALPLQAGSDLSDMVRLLKSLALQQLVLRLRPRNSALSDLLQVSLAVRRAGQADWQPIVGVDATLPVVDEDDELSLTLSPSGAFLDPLGSAPALLHVAVLHLSASGEVRVWVSDRSNPPQVARGGRFDLGRLPGERHALHIAPGYPPAGWENLADPAALAALAPARSEAQMEPAPATAYVQDLIHVFIGTRPLQEPLHAALQTTPQTSARAVILRGGAAAPARWLAGALRGRRYRRSPAKLPSPASSPSVPREDWTRIALPIIVRKRLRLDSEPKRSS